MNKILEIVENLNLAFRLVGKDVNIIVGMLNEQTAKINELEARLAALEAN